MTDMDRFIAAADALAEAMIRIEDLTQHDMGMCAAEERVIHFEAQSALLIYRAARGPITDQVGDWTRPYTAWNRRADLPPDPLGAVKVKPLVWVDLHGDGSLYETSNDHPLGYHASINSRGADGFWYFELHPTLEAAKAAAQADYETRIRSALEPCDPLSNPRVKALVEALSGHQIWEKAEKVSDDEFVLWTREGSVCLRLKATHHHENMGAAAFEFVMCDLLDLLNARAALAALSPTGGNADGYS